MLDREQTVKSRAGRSMLEATRAWGSDLTRKPDRAVAVLIAGFLVFHGVVAVSLGLSADESYGIGVAHDLSLSYFDHPPLNYWIAHAFMPLLGDGRLLRLPFVAMFAGTTWALYRLTAHLFGAGAGLWAALALNLSGYFTLASGWVLPDGPLMLCLMAAAAAIARGLFADTEGAQDSPWRSWIVAGLWLGLAGLSKYHAGLFVVGLAAFVASVPGRRRLLLHPAPWLGAVVAAVIISPVVIWNARHGWASFTFQSGRALGDGSFPNLNQFVNNLGGQLLYLLPWVLVPMLIAAVAALGKSRASERSWFCLCLGLPPVLLFTVVPLWAGRVLPHWEMPGWLMLFPLLGDHLAREAAIRSRPRSWAITSAALLGVLAAMLVGYVHTGYGKRAMTTAVAVGDPTLDFIEWSPLREELQRRGLLATPGLFVIAGSRIDIGTIDQALHDALPMQVFGDGRAFDFRIDPRSLIGRDALIMGRRDRLDNIPDGLLPYFESIEELPSFAFGRSGRPEIDVRIFYGRGLKRPLPSPYGNWAG